MDILAPPEYIRKRDGTIEPFSACRIYSAVHRAGVASREVDAVTAQAVSQSVISKLSNNVHVEAIQDAIEYELWHGQYFRTARAYIVYREQHRVLREDSKTTVDVAKSINEYLSRADWRVNANANQDYSLGGLILNSAGKMIANYWLSHVYPPEIGEAHRNASIHIHDLDFLSGYCAGWSLRMLLEEGLGGVQSRVQATPPSHMSSAIGQIVNFFGTLQNEWAGAQAFSSFDTYIAPFVRKDRLGYAQVKQHVQALIFNLNVPSRWGSQAPFTNLTFDIVCPDDLKDKQPIIAGEAMPFCYGELQPEMDLINQAFIEIMTAGDSNGRTFTFPIPTYNITQDFDWDSPNADRLFEMTAKYGVPYFQNFIGSDLQPNMVRSMCCRLQLDLRELLKRGNGLFGSAEQTGSVGVVTINCARLGWLHPYDTAGLYASLDALIDLAVESLEIKRKTIQRLMDAGLFPYTKRYLGTLRNHFSTIGVNGINEMIRNFSSDTHDITSEWGHAKSVELLEHIRGRMVQAQERTGHLYNLEATPAEGTTYRFAKEDQVRCPGILQAGTAEAPYYTNSSQLPVGYTDDAFKALEMQEDLQAKYTGGTVLHLYMGERMSGFKSCKALVRRALERFRIPYLTISPTFSICPIHGYLSGEHEYCPNCDEILLAEQRIKADPITNKSVIYA